MGITPMFGSGLIAAQVAAFQNRVEEDAIFLCKYLGEELVKYAKNKHNYTDRTGNLTNSISYVVVKNKDIVFGPADQSDKPQEAAMKAAMKMIATLPDCVALVIVAGMNYAAYVEAKGYNVILPAELKAKTDFPKAMQKLMEKAKAKATDMFGIAI